MGSEGIGECSQRNNNHNNEEDGSGDSSERPLKKARYVWQVKGKYHLKDSLHSTNRESNESSQGCSGDGPGNVIEENDMSKRVENGVNNNGSNNNNNNVKCDNRRCDGRCIETFLAQSETMMTDEESSDGESSPRNMDKLLSDESPPTLIKRNKRNQDYYLNKWQARQVAKGFLDNTINSVLENWTTTKCSPFLEMGSLYDDDDDGIVEDEGILMAIQSHGLQNWGESSHNLHRNNAENPTSFVRAQEIESARDNYENVYNELLKKQNQLKSESPNNEDDHLENIEMGDHINFLDAAVSVAIQKKGLISQNYV